MTNYTTTRHAVLAEFAQSPGRRLTFAGMDPIWVDAANTALRGNDLRAASWLWNHDALKYGEGQRADGGTIVLTDDGVTLLGQWDSEHPEVMSDIAGVWRVVGSRAKTDTEPEERITLTNGPVTIDVRTGDTRTAAALAARLSTDPSLADPDHPLAYDVTGGLSDAEKAYLANPDLMETVEAARAHPEDRVSGSTRRRRDPEEKAFADLTEDEKQGRLDADEARTFPTDD